MNKIKDTIGWADYSWNPVIGCNRGCSYCYGKKISDRFKMIPDFSVPTFFPKRLYDRPPKKPCKIFVGSMTDICYWKPEWVKEVIDYTKAFPEHIFMFLTKDGTIYGEYDFPDNCWLGMTYTKSCLFSENQNNKKCKKFLSIEPLMEEFIPSDICRMFDLIIVGGLTPKTVHQNSWVDKIIYFCKVYNIPYFLKNNLHYKKEGEVSRVTLVDNFRKGDCDA